ncbi:hypothetical protein BY458DRAFT_504516 [Sporodiniella umbellata]|nr:hypothetical protein BY458DRAFT_504516 [Sporodiniella umbellata]
MTSHRPTTGSSLISSTIKNNCRMPDRKSTKEKKRAESIHCKESGRPTTRSRAALPPLPTVSSSMPTTGAGSPVVHHHYHYYMKNKGEPAEEEEEEVDSLTENVPERSQSPEEIKYPFVFLQDQIRQILNRFQDTNLIVLNRRLKRTFDIVEISRMSNAVIENIMGDIGALETHFLWLREEDDPHLFSFFSFLQALKDALQELGSLKQTINELQMAYVQKVEENELRVEEEIVQKRIHKRKARATPSSSPLSWLTTVFYRSSNNTVHFLDEDEHTLVRSSHPKEDPLRSHRRNYRQQKLSPALPIVRSKRSFHRLDEPAPIRSMIVASSDNVNSSSSDIPSVTLSSSWLGGK